MTDFKPLFLTSFFCVAHLSFFVTFVGAKLLYDYFVRSAIQNVRKCDCGRQPKVNCRNSLTKIKHLKATYRYGSSYERTDKGRYSVSKKSSDDELNTL